MNNFKELLVWKKAMELTTEVYEATRTFPAEEKFGLKSQIQRSAVSIPSNIAEGAGRGTKKDFSNFLSISLSSSYELETQVIISNNLNLIEPKTHENLIFRIAEIQKMIVGLKKSLFREMESLKN
jgi:four helix bundle protein